MLVSPSSSSLIYSIYIYLQQKPVENIKHDFRNIYLQKKHFIYLFIYLIIEGLYVNRSGSPQGFSQVHISHKLKTIQNMHIAWKQNI